jgi:RecA-family ATPase
MRNGAGAANDKAKGAGEKPALRVVGEAEAYRHVPYDVEIEQALLGAVLVDNAALDRFTSILRPEHLYDPLHRRIYEAMLSLNGELTINPLTLNAALKADPGLIEVGGHTYLAGLASAAPAMPNVRDYARILHDLAIRRGLIRVGEDIVTGAYEAPLEHSPLAQLQASEAALQELWNTEAEHVGGRLPVIDMARWEGQETPQRRWHVRERIPGRNVTLLSGEGSVGKTLIAEQLAVATVLGMEWLGVVPERGPVLLVCCEDDEDEMHIRFRSIAEFYGASFADLRNDLYPVSLVGLDTILAQPDRKDGLIQPTPLYHRIARLAKDIKPALIVLDNSADMYAGNENDRAQVRQFITWLRRMAVTADAAVLLTSHPSVRGAETGTGISGSTAWHASVRARLYMRRPKMDGDQQPDPDERVLEVMKSNYGPAGEAISLRWEKGLFVPADGPHWLDKRATETAVDEAFLRLLVQYEAQGRNVSHKSSAPGSYAPKLFAAEPAAGGTRKQAFESAMNRLFNDGRIHVAKYGKPSRQFERIASGAPQ